MKSTVVGMFKYAGKGGTVAFFDIILDDVLVLKGCTLKQSKDGDYYWKPPAKPRMKNGVQVTDDAGRGLWDDHYRLMTGDDKKLTKPAYAFSQAVLEQAVGQFESTDEGRGKPKKAKVAAATSTKTDDAGDGDDEGLPF